MRGLMAALVVILVGVSAIAETRPLPRPETVTRAAPAELQLPRASQRPLPRPQPEIFTPRPPIPELRPDVRPTPAYLPDGTRIREPAPDCDPTGTHCIALKTRTADTCSLIENLAKANDLPPEFFFRLIWRESLFDPSAISPAGALGIAQFMPQTARLRGLTDPFNPAWALVASAEYLADLRDRFGSLGLAAVAYNGGEARAEKFLAGDNWLAGETRAYVAAITGLSARDWRADPEQAPDLTLDPKQPFAAACLAQARTRKVQQFKTRPAGPDLKPWAVIIAAHQNRPVAQARADAVTRRNRVLQNHDVVVAKVQLASMRRSQYVAQVGAGTQSEALSICRAVRQAGSYCTVLRN